MVRQPISSAGRLLSDIPLHREQAPESLFFAPDSAEALAQRLLEAGQRPRLPRDSVAVLQGRQQMRRRDYAAALLTLFENVRGITPWPSGSSVLS